MDSISREQLINLIYMSNEKWTCPNRPCDLPEIEGNTGECCLKCADKLLTKYENELLKKNNSWHYLDEGVGDLPNDEENVIIEIEAANNYVYTSTENNHIIGVMFLKYDGAEGMHNCFESVLGRYPVEDVIRWKYID